jgi:hypothetical protein
MLTLNYSSNAGDVETGSNGSQQYCLQQSCGVITLKAASVIGEEYTLEMMTKNKLKNMGMYDIYKITIACTAIHAICL